MIVRIRVGARVVVRTRVSNGARKCSLPYSTWFIQTSIRIRVQVWGEVGIIIILGQGRVTG